MKMTNLSKMLTGRVSEVHDVLTKVSIAVEIIVCCRVVFLKLHSRQARSESNSEDSRRQQWPQVKREITPSASGSPHTAALPFGRRRSLP